MPEETTPTLAEQIRNRRIVELKNELASHREQIERQQAEIEIKSAQLAALETKTSK